MQMKLYSNKFQIEVTHVQSSLIDGALNRQLVSKDPTSSHMLLQYYTYCIYNFEFYLLNH